MPTETTPTRERSELRIFQFEFKVAGKMDSEQAFIVGWNQEHAAERLENALAKTYRADTPYAISSTVLELRECDLPSGKAEHARIADKVRRQKDELAPLPPKPKSGPIFVFWIQQPSGAKSRHVVVNRDENANAARRSAEQHAAENGLKLLPGYGQSELDDFIADLVKRGRSRTEVFSQLTPNNARELALMLRDAFALEVAEFGQRIAREALELHNFPQPAKLQHKCPRPSALCQVGMEILQRVPPASETAADKREKLERRREAIHASV